jgi:lipopolysaccharide biosynthesis glycosyltransferase
LKTGDKKAIREITGLHNAEVEFVTVERGMFEKLKLNIEHISVETYYRYILPDILPRNIKKVLYLDADILVAGDIGYLWNEDIEKYYIAGVEDTLILDENYKKDQ